MAELDNKKLVGAVSGATAAVVPFTLDPGYSKKVKAFLVGGGIAQAYPTLHDLFVDEDEDATDEGGIDFELIVAVSGIIATGMGVFTHYQETKTWDEGTIAVAVTAAAHAAMLLYDALKEDEAEDPAATPAE